MSLLHTSDKMVNNLITVAFAVTLALLYIDAEFILLVTAHVGVAHEKDGVVVVTRGGGHKVQFDLGLLLQGQSPDGQQRVGLVVPYHHPPAFLSFLVVKRKKTIQIPIRSQ